MDVREPAPAADAPMPSSPSGGAAPTAASAEREGRLASAEPHTAAVPPPPPRSPFRSLAVQPPRGGGFGAVPAGRARPASAPPTPGGGARGPSSLHGKLTANATRRRRARRAPSPSPLCHGCIHGSSFFSSAPCSPCASSAAGSARSAPAGRSAWPSPSARAEPLHPAAARAARPASARRPRSAGPVSERAFSLALTAANSAAVGGAAWSAEGGGLCAATVREEASIELRGAAHAGHWVRAALRGPARAAASSLQPLPSHAAARAGGGAGGAGGGGGGGCGGCAGGSASYVLRYEPAVSGRYALSITAGGAHVPGSPFAVTVAPAAARAAAALARGAGLSRARVHSAAHAEVELRTEAGARLGRGGDSVRAWLVRAPAHAAHASAAFADAAAGGGRWPGAQLDGEGGGRPAERPPPAAVLLPAARGGGGGARYAHARAAAGGAAAAAAAVPGGGGGGGGGALGGAATAAAAVHAAQAAARAHGNALACAASPVRGCMRATAWGAALEAELTSSAWAHGSPPSAAPRAAHGSAPPPPPPPPPPPAAAAAQPPPADATAATVVDHGDGRYSLSYTPARTGAHALWVTVGGAHVRGSPFAVAVVAGPAVVAHTSVHAGAGCARVPRAGAGLGAEAEWRVVAGSAAELLLCARDAHRVPVGPEGALELRPSARLVRSSAPSAPPDTHSAAAAAAAVWVGVHARSDGLLALPLRVEQPGEYELAVWLTGQGRARAGKAAAGCGGVDADTVAAEGARPRPSFRPPRAAAIGSADASPSPSAAAAAADDDDDDADADDADDEPESPPRAREGAPLLLRVRALAPAAAHTRLVPAGDALALRGDGDGAAAASALEPAAPLRASAGVPLRLELWPRDGFGRALGGGAAEGGGPLAEPLSWAAQLLPQGRQPRGEEAAEEEEEEAGAGAGRPAARQRARATPLAALRADGSRGIELRVLCAQAGRHTLRLWARAHALARAGGAAAAADAAAASAASAALGRASAAEWVEVAGSPWAVEVEAGEVSAARCELLPPHAHGAAPHTAPRHPTAGSVHTLAVALRDAHGNARAGGAVHDVVHCLALNAASGESVVASVRRAPGGVRLARFTPRTAGLWAVELAVRPGPKRVAAPPAAAGSPRGRRGAPAETGGLGGAGAPAGRGLEPIPGSPFSLLVLPGPPATHMLAAFALDPAHTAGADGAELLPPRAGAGGGGAGGAAAPPPSVPDGWSGGAREAAAASALRALAAARDGGRPLPRLQLRARAGDTIALGLIARDSLGNVRTPPPQAPGGGAGGGGGGAEGGGAEPAGGGRAWGGAWGGPHDALSARLRLLRSAEPGGARGRSPDPSPRRGGGGAGSPRAGARAVRVSTAAALGADERGACGARRASCASCAASSAASVRVAADESELECALVWAEALRCHVLSCTPALAGEWAVLGRAHGTALGPGADGVGAGAGGGAEEGAGAAEGSEEGGPLAVLATVTVLAGNASPAHTTLELPTAAPSGGGGGGAGPHRLPSVAASSAARLLLRARDALGNARRAGGDGLAVALLRPELGGADAPAQQQQTQQQQQQTQQQQHARALAPQRRLSLGGAGAGADGGGGASPGGHGLHGAHVPCLDLGDGSYGLSVDARAAGVYTLHVTAASRPLAQPGLLRLLVSAAAPHASRSTLRAAQPSARVGEPCAALLITRDAHGNVCARGGAAVSAALRGPSRAPPPDVVDLHSGEYRLGFTPQRPGLHVLEAWVGGAKLGGACELSVLPAEGAGAAGAGAPDSPARRTPSSAGSVRAASRGNTPPTSARAPRTAGVGAGSGGSGARRGEYDAPTEASRRRQEAKQHAAARASAGAASPAALAPSSSSAAAAAGGGGAGGGSNSWHRSPSTT